MNTRGNYTGNGGRITTIILAIMAVMFLFFGGVIYALLSEVVFLSIIFFGCSALFLFFSIHSYVYMRNEEERNRRKDEARVAGVDDMPLRAADFSCKYKVLVGTTAVALDLRICYRRIGNNLNELIVNDNVYDEKSGVIEYAHNLSAVVNGHRIDAGFDGISQSYVRVDGVQIASKGRVV